MTEGNSIAAQGDRRALTPGAKTLIMGVINITPDSFFDGGKLDSVAEAARYAARLTCDGADILDVGGESSRPGAAPVGCDEELRRVLPVLEQIQDLEVALSVDTCRAETARRALEAGADMINDISAAQQDPAMAEVIAAAGCPYVLMHMQGTPETMQQAPRYDCVIDDVCAFFEQRMKALVAEGVQEDQIWLDPGFGFGKRVAHNLTILNRLTEFRRFGRPLLIGTSNKSTIGTVLNLPVDDRMEGTAATVAIAIAHGADCVRVHDVRAMARVARMCDAVLRGRY